MFQATLPSIFLRLQAGPVNPCWLTMRAPGRRDSHRQNELVLALSFSVSEMSPNPPAAGNASR